MAQPSIAKPGLSVGRSRAVRSGRTGEAVVADLATVARIKGVAHLVKVPTPTAGSPGKGMRYVARSTVDFVGFRMVGGKHIAIEVKTMAGSGPFYMHEIEPHQREYLDAVERASGLAFVAVVFGPARRVALFPWWSIQPITGAIAAQDLAANAVDAAHFCEVLATGIFPSTRGAPS